MFRIDAGKTNRYCDGVSRRSFLQVGVAGMASVGLGSVMAAQAKSAENGAGKKDTAVILLWLDGGPGHMDMYDMKPEAPPEYRGIWNPIKTNVDGFEICELFPRLATMADKFAVIRSLVGMVDDHSNFHTQTGYPRSDLRNIGGRPGIGAVVSKLLGPSGSGAPAHIAYSDGPVGYLGPVYKGYRPSGGDLRLTGEMTANRLENRTNLLSSLDSLRREVDASGQIVSDTFEGEFRRSVENLRKVLEAAGCTLADVIQTRNYVRDASDVVEYNKLYREYFTEPYPTRTTITNCLPPALKYEIEAVAVAKSKAA